MKEQKKFKKKVVIKNEKTTSKAKAARLKKIRNMANLSRDQMCDETININTYNGWETGRYGGLPVDGAERVVKRVAKEGVACTAEWLLYGVGTPAYVIANFYQSSKASNIGDENALIFNEITVFKTQFAEAIECQIIDDGLSPCFSIDDIVAGVKHYGDAINKLLNNICIVQLADKNIVVRLLKKSAVVNKFTLLCTNPETSVLTPAICDVEILSAAPILRHYKQLSK